MKKFSSLAARRRSSFRRRRSRTRRVSPPVALAKVGQVYTLAVPTEKEGATTTQVELTPPPGFSIDSFVPAAGLDSARCSRPAPARTR